MRATYGVRQRGCSLPKTGGRKRSIPATKGKRATAARKALAAPKLLSAIKPAVGNDPEKSDPAGSPRDCLHESLQIADLVWRQRQQHANCSHHVAEGHKQAGGEESPGKNTARVLDLLP